MPEIEIEDEFWQRVEVLAHEGSGDLQMLAAALLQLEQELLAPLRDQVEQLQERLEAIEVAGVRRE